MSWAAKTSLTPPAKGTSKLLYSANLVDSINGTYGVVKPDEVRYLPVSGNQYAFFDGLYEIPDGQGYLLCTLSAGNTNTGTYWSATYKVETKVGRNVVFSGAYISGSQTYQYIPSYVEPYQEVSKIIPVLSDFTRLVDEGDYYVVFESITIYSATGNTPPITFGTSSISTIPVQEYEVSITIGGTTTVNFTLP